MKRKYVVIDEQGNVSWKMKPEGPESFRSWDAAKKRAEALAELSPGETIEIYELIGEASCEVKPVVTSRAK